MLPDPLPFLFVKVLEIWVRRDDFFKSVGGPYFVRFPDLVEGVDHLDFINEVQHQVWLDQALTQLDLTCP